MKVNVVGFRKSSFTTKDGDQISGYQIYLGTPISENGEGIAVDRAFVTINKMISAPALGAAEIEYNKYGKVENFTSLEKGK